MQLNVPAVRSMNRLRGALAIAVALVMGSCGGGGNETPTSPSAVTSPLRGASNGEGDAALDATSSVEAQGEPKVSSVEAQGGPKVSLCHREGNGSYHHIEVSSRAEDAHRAHGDAPPFAPVPGQPGKFFNEACEVVDFCPGCPPTRTVTAG